MSKEAIFIRHAAPEDNDFTRWLGAKLELAGYRVWHDVARLKGGDIFWDKIEAAIRDESFRMVAVISKVSIHKPPTNKSAASVALPKPMAAAAKPQEGSRLGPL